LWFGELSALQSNHFFSGIAEEDTELESQIADRREFYNDAINVSTRDSGMPDTMLRVCWNEARLIFK